MKVTSEIKPHPLTVDTYKKSMNFVNATTSAMTIDVTDRARNFLLLLCLYF